MPDVIVVAGQSNACHLAQKLSWLLKCDVIDGSAGGTSLLENAADSQGEFWLNEGRGSPLADLCKQLQGHKIVAVWWIQGENEALFGPIREENYLTGLIWLRWRLARHSIFDHSYSLPFVVSPVAAIDERYKHARPVLAAQYRSVDFNFVLGPEYYDLPFDGVHLTEEGRAEFAKRGAAVLAPLIRRKHAKSLDCVSDALPAGVSGANGQRDSSAHPRA